MKRGNKENIYFAVFIALFILFCVLTIYIKKQQEPSLQPTSPETQIWFGPNMASQDYLQLFSREDLWPNSRRNVDVFVFYSESLENKTTDPCPYCGVTSYKTLSNVNAFTKLNDWGIKVAIDVPVIKEWDCDTTVTTPITHKVIKNLRLAGADVDYLAFDEPYYSGVDRIVNGRNCGLTMQESAIVTANYMANISESFPGVKLGDMEPYPKYSAQQIMDWVNELERLGARLDFFHLDVNHNFGQRPVDPLELITLKNFFENKGIEFGVILWYQPRPPSSSNYTNGTLEWTNYVIQNEFYGTDHIIQSWVGDIPINLPETAVNQTHTNLILGALPIILDNDAQFLGQNVPNTMSSGQSYPVSITLLNNGTEIWEEQELYKLVSQNPLNNVWGINEVNLNPQEKIYPNQEKTFLFTVTAPITQGVYDFQWKMLHENIEIFGQLTDNLRINVESSSISIPNSPSDLVGSVILPNNLRLDWRDNSDNEQGFILEYKSASSQNWLIVSGANNLAPGTTSFTHSNIPAGNYDYRVGAFNQAGISYSEPISVTIDYNLRLSSLSPNKILRTVSNIISVIGTGFDENSKVLVNGIDITSLSLTSYVNPQLIVIMLSPQILAEFLGDYSISVKSGDGLVTTSSQNLRINLPFDYLPIIPFSVVSLNPQEPLDSFMEIQSNTYMDQEIVSLYFGPLTDIGIEFIGPSSCTVDTSLQPPLCRINFTITPNSLSSGQYNLTFNSNSSLTSVKHQINITINVGLGFCGDNICNATLGETCSSCSLDCSCNSGSTSSGSGSGSGSSGGITKIVHECEDKKDNDNDGKIDYPEDEGCYSQTDNSELDLENNKTSTINYGDNDEQNIQQEKSIQLRIFFIILIIVLALAIVIISIIIVRQLKKNKIKSLATILKSNL